MPTPLEKFAHLSQFDNLTHFVTNSSIGNISYTTHDNSTLIQENRQKLAEAVGITVNDFCVPQQTHAANVALITEQHRGMGAWKAETALPATDALITQTQGICLTVLSADCALLLLYDAKNNAVGAVHSGWRGTMQHIAQHTLEAMHASFGTNPAQVWVGIAPCISTDVYEVGEEVVEATLKSFGTMAHYLAYNKATARWHFDLRYANSQMLQNVGVPKSQIEISPMCTYLNPHLYYSARLTQGKTGRFGAGIMLK